MSEIKEEVLDIDAEKLHEALKSAVMEDTRENAKANKDRGVFMGKIFAKKFYIIFKEPYMPSIDYLTVLAGDIEATEDGKTRLRYKFKKSKTAIFFSSILLAIVTVLVVLALTSGRLSIPVYICVFGFWAMAIAMYFMSIFTSKAGRERLIGYIRSLANL